MHPSSITACLLLLAAAAALADPWPAFRGPDGAGISFERALPVNWDQADLAWKVEVAPGNASPIVWEDRVFLTVAHDGGKLRGVVCYDRRTGRELWGEALPAPEEPHHKTSPHAAASPVTDGQRIYAMLGSAGLAAWSLDGELLWNTSLGPVRHIWAHASSPVLFEDLVIQLVGPGVNCRLVALDRRSGKEVWQRELPQAKAVSDKQWFGSWSTPVLRRLERRAELLIALPGELLAVNPQSGRTLWRCTGLGDLVYTSPALGNEIVVAMGGYKGPTIACRLPGPEGADDITASHRLWRHDKNPQRIGSGVIVAGYLYLIEEPGVAKCLNAKTGELIWEQRVGAATWASILYAESRLYITDTFGTTHVIDAATRFKRLAENKLPNKETTRATPAFSDGQIFIRTHDHLYCFGRRNKS